MRNRQAFTSCMLAAAGVLAAATVTLAGNYGSSTSTPTAAPPPPPTSCVAGAYQVSVSHGPLIVSCTATSTNPSGQCTEIEYSVAGGVPDHVGVAEGVGIQYVVGPGNQWYDPCVGDPVTDIGEHSCHEQAAKFNPTSSVQKFTIGLAGVRNPSPTTVGVKKGSRVALCTIQGIGLDNVASPFQTTAKIETKVFKGCAVTFQLDPATGAVLSAQLDLNASTKPLCQGGEQPGTCCSDVLSNDISALQLTLNGTSLGTPKFGNGYISSGENSCTSYVIGGRIYSWGSPCP